jgi:hypothetical protein
MTWGLVRGTNQRQIRQETTIKEEGMRGDVYQRERAVKEKMPAATARGGGRQPNTTACVGGRQQALGEEMFI